jgi:hypothetical protein
VARFWHTLLVVDDRQGDALVFRRDKEEEEEEEAA